jgi:hypothetical protein
MATFDRLSNLLLAIFDLSLDALRFIRLSLQPSCTPAAENLFLREQLALYLERHVEPRRPRAAAQYGGPISVGGRILGIILATVVE